jgi:hypothetical protein
MATYEEKIKSVKEKLSEFHKKRALLVEEESKLNTELELIKLEEHAKNSGLTEDEIKEIKKSIQVIGNMLSDNNVMFGTLRILNEDPDITYGGHKCDEQQLKFSIKIECNFVADFGIGLIYNVSIKTKNETIVRIINEMISTTNSDMEDYDEEGNIIVKPEVRNKTSWEIDWDYHQKFILKS